ncbi:hypothetical protein C1752_08485 [Acaryochloris thomasi RCC1774]|uniref:Uncharacterized protein n=1 Tax=Acaryochloris thomasi RCC1774 TaxID=1764569 RepID=A0A2W1J9Y2_9CYAN|nr:hypothetical protein [Acaryochloris thomasi]PZD71043.1 hypothetical protein C1752_08485 [Acaryochloris thomasi RCC1774]
MKLFKINQLLATAAIIILSAAPGKAEPPKYGQACITGEDVNARWALKHENPATFMQGRTFDRADLHKAVTSLGEYQPLDRPVEYVFSRNEGVEIVTHPLNGIKRGGIAWTMVSYPILNSSSYDVAWVASKFLRKPDYVNVEELTGPGAIGTHTAITCRNVTTHRSWF